MLVSAGALKQDGRVLGAGDPIPKPDTWRPGILQILMNAGKIVDVSPEEAERMRARETLRGIRTLGIRASRKLREAESATQALAARKDELVGLLDEVEQAHGVAEAQELEAAHELDALCEKYGADVLGVEPREQPKEPEPTQASPTTPEPEPTQPATDDAVQAKAVAALGGFHLRQLRMRVQAWYGLDLEDHLGKRARKGEAQALAYKIFHALWRAQEEKGEDLSTEETHAIARQVVAKPASSDE